MARSGTHDPAGQRRRPRAARASRARRLVCTLLIATGTVVKSGSRVGFTEAVVTDASGAAVATASSTLLVFDL